MHCTTAVCWPIVPSTLAQSCNNQLVPARAERCTRFGGSNCAVALPSRRGSCVWKGSCMAWLTALGTAVKVGCWLRLPSRRQGLHNAGQCCQACCCVVMAWDRTRCSAVGHRACCCAGAVVSTQCLGSWLLLVQRHGCCHSALAKHFQTGAGVTHSEVGTRSTHTRPNRQDTLTAPAVEAKPAVARYNSNI